MKRPTAGGAAAPSPRGQDHRRRDGRMHPDGHARRPQPFCARGEAAAATSAGATLATVMKDAANERAAAA